MKLLLKALLRHKQHFVLLGCSLLAILGLAVSSQVEIFSLGMIAKTGPDAFVLFAQKKEGRLEKSAKLSRQQVLDQWSEIAKDAEEITPAQAHEYISRYGKGNLSIAGRLSNYISQYIDLTRFRSLAMFLVLVAIFKAVTLFFQRFLSQAVAIRVSRDLRKDYFQALQKLPMKFFHTHDMGNLSSRVTTDSASIAQAVNALMINYVQAPITLVCALGVCLSISWKFALVVSVAFPILILPIIIIARKIKALAKRIQTNQDKFSSVLLDFLSGIITVKTYQTEDYALKKYCDQNNQISTLEEKSAFYGLLPRPLLHTISSLFFALVVIVGLYKFQIPPEELIVFCGLLYLIYDPVKKFGDENTTIMRGCAAAERFYEVLSHSDLHLESVGEKEFIGLTQSIEFRNVSFSYDNMDRMVLKDLNFTIRKGEAIGIVGPTGSGKTTIGNLLTRLYEVSEGAVLLDGEPIQSYTMQSLRQQFGCVLQHPFLFYDTVWNNLTFGKEFSEEEVIHALKQASAYEFVQNMPEGMHSLLKESGKNLSGGQKQRLTIARALLKNASVLLLDEATSSLDAISENYIKEIIERLKGHCTQIIIAHKLSTLEHVDRIIYLEQGRKIAEGTKQELLQTCPAFQKMWELSGIRERQDSHEEELVLIQED